MPRQIELRDDCLHARFSGLMHFETLTAKLDIPYEDILSVSTEPFQPPPGTLRLGGTSVPFTDIREGHFLCGHDWFFLSYENRHETITIALRDGTIGRRRYRFVVLGVDDKEAMREAILAHMTS